MSILWEKTGVRRPGLFELGWNRWGLAAAVIFDHDERLPWMLHIHFLLLNVFVHFPAPRIKHDATKYGEWQQWGFRIEPTYIAFNRNYGYKSFDWPWAYEHMRHEVLRPDGKWVPFVGSWEHDKEPDGRKIERFTYRYILKNGEVQYRNADVYVERRAWRQQRTGSWKGGTVGCGYDLRPHETPERCLRRMEQERKFD